MTNETLSKNEKLILFSVHIGFESFVLNNAASKAVCDLHDKELIEYKKTRGEHSTIKDWKTFLTVDGQKKMKEILEAEIEELP